MTAFNYLFVEKKKTSQDLIQFYVRVVKEKFLYQYDPKKLIIDLLPYKKVLLTAFITNRNYTLSQSVQDFGRLEYVEHRFINFLKFTEFSNEEIKQVFDAHEAICKSHDVREKYQYSNTDLFITGNTLKDMPTITEKGELRMATISHEEIEKLYSKR